MSKLELTAEELKLITELREQKAAEEAKEAAEKAKAKKKIGLEKQFKKEVKVVREKINVHIENARQELKKALKISEETGIPFNSNVVETGWRERGYIPISFKDKWSVDDPSLLLEDLGIYGDYEGFENWSFSSLTC